MQTKKIKTTANRRLAKKRAKWLNEVLCFVSSSVLADSLVLRNPLLRQAPKRYGAFIKETKMKISTFTIVLSLVSIFCPGHNWAPTGATWYYEVVDAFSPTLTYAKYESIGDTNILGKNCKIITQTVGSNSYDFLIGRISTAYSYELNGKVYVYNASNSNFSLIYDFAADSGDTWVTTWDTCNYLRTILHTDSILINGNYFKTLSYGSSEIIERIGGVRTLFHGLGPVSCDPPDSFVVELPFTQRLRCYQDSIIGFYNTGISPACDFVTTIGPINNFENLGTIYPNPTSSELNFHLNNQLLSELEINLFNSLGQNLKTINIYTENTAIDLTGIESGIYLIIANNKAGRHWARRIIINAP